MKLTGGLEALADKLTLHSVMWEVVGILNENMGSVGYANVAFSCCSGR